MRARTGTLALAAILAVLPASSATAQTIEPEYLEEMEVLAAEQAVRNALSRVEDLDPWGMDLLVELTEIPAPPFMEEVRAACFAELLREAGSRQRVDRRRGERARVEAWTGRGTYRGI